MTDYIYNTDGELVNAEELYDDYLDSEGYVDVMGLEFLPSRIISELDPIAYRCGFNDYMDGLYSDGEYGEAIIRVLTEDGEVESVTMYREESDARDALGDVYRDLDPEYTWTVQVINASEEVTHEVRIEAAS